MTDDIFEACILKEGKSCLTLLGCKYIPLPLNYAILIFRCIYMSLSFIDTNSIAFLCLVKKMAHTAYPLQTKLLLARKPKITTSLFCHVVGNILVLHLTTNSLEFCSDCLVRSPVQRNISANS